MADISSGRTDDALAAGYVCQPSADQLLRPLHDRIPVIMAPDDYSAWLGDDAARNVIELLRRCPSEAMQAYRVSTAVNNVKNDGPDCVDAFVHRLRRHALSDGHCSRA